MSARRLPVWECVGAAARFVPAAWGGAWGALALTGASEAGLMLAAGGALGGGAGILVALTLTTLLLALVTDGALYRLGVFGRDARREGLGVGGLQLGRTELRLLLARLLIGLFLLLIGIAAIVVLAVALTAGGLGEVDFSALKSLDELRALAGPVQLVVIAALVVGVAAIFLLLSVRFSLFAAATVGRRQVVALNALGLAEGRFWPLLAGLVVVSLPAIGVFAWQKWHGPFAGQELMFFAAAQAAIYAFIHKPLVAGFLSAAYRRLEYVSAELQGE